MRQTISIQASTCFHTSSLKCSVNVSHSFILAAWAALRFGLIAMWHHSWRWVEFNSLLSVALVQHYSRWVTDLMARCCLFLHHHKLFCGPVTTISSSKWQHGKLVWNHTIKLPIPATEIHATLGLNRISLYHINPPLHKAISKITNSIASYHNKPDCGESD